MPGPLYNYVKDSFRIHIQQDAEDMIQKASSAPPQVTTHKMFLSPQFNSSKFQDLMSSLLLLRSHDINTTNRNLIYLSDGVMPRDTVQRLEQETSREGVTRSDVLFSITTMPCRCPIVLECCINISSDDLNYLVVFQQDKDFLSRQGINSITKLAEFSRERRSHDEIEANWRQMMMDSTQYNVPEPIYPERQIYNLASLTRDKMKIWDIESNEVAIPLMNMLRKLY
jgi:hypothetical protein